MFLTFYANWFKSWLLMFCSYMRWNFNEVKKEKKKNNLQTEVEKKEGNVFVLFFKKVI